MLKTIRVKYFIGNLIFDSENSSINGISIVSKINKTKFKINFSAKFAKFGNMVRSDFLIQFKLLAKMSSRLAFFIPKAKLVFIKLRQEFYQNINLSSF